jgi:hypothetical protein
MGEDIAASDEADGTAELGMLRWWREGLPGGIPADRFEEDRVEQQRQLFLLALAGTAM